MLTNGEYTRSAMKVVKLTYIASAMLGTNAHLYLGCSKNGDGNAFSWLKCTLIE